MKAPSALPSVVQAVFGLALLAGLAAAVSAQREQPSEYREVIDATPFYFNRRHR